MLQPNLLQKKLQKQQNNEIHHSINQKGKLAIVYPFFLEANPAFRYKIFQRIIFSNAKKELPLVIIFRKEII
jgi:hypothetical protein